MWTSAYLRDLSLPEGKTKLSITDPETRGLVFEVRPAGRSFYLRYTIEGRQRTLPLGPFPTMGLSEARRRAEELKLRIHMGDDPLQQKRKKTDCPTIQAFYEQVYAPFSKSQHRDVYGNASLYKNHIGPRFGSKRMNEISKIMIRNWTHDLLARGYSPAMINRTLILFGQLFTIANELGIADIPARSEVGIKLLKVTQKHTTHLSNAEVKRLADALEDCKNPHVKYIISFMLVTGARRSEALHARWEHIDLINKTWVVPLSKSGQPRHIFLNDAAVAILHALRSDMTLDDTTGYLFANPKTQKPYRCIFNAWKRVRELAGLPNLRIHDLRHSYASTLVNNGVSLYDVQKLLGHSNIKTTQRYAHLSSERLSQSASVADKTYGAALGLSTTKRRTEIPTKNLPSA